MADEGWVVVNPGARPRGGMVELDVPGEGPIAGAQTLSERGAIVADQLLDAGDARAILANLRSQDLGGRTFINGIECAETDDDVELTLECDRRLYTNILVADAMRDAQARLDARPGARLHLVIRRQPYRRILVQVPDVPGFGWRLIGDVQPPAHPVHATDLADGLTNGLVTITMDTGSFSLDGVGGCDRLVDGGDLGDTYNYSPPDTDLSVETPVTSSWRIVESGPVRGRIVWERTSRWPARIKEHQRVGEHEVAVTTTLELRADEPFVRVTTRFVNPSRDHRLRAHFPLPRPATVSRAECAFAVVERRLEAEGGPTERALPTFPSRRFVQAGGLTLVHEGLLEYELVDGGRELALTLLRATGMLSRVEMAYRPLPAGPPITMEGPQMLGPVEVRYALGVDEAVDPYAMADEVLLPMPVRATKGGGPRSPEGCELEVTGAEVSTLRRVPGGLELRVFNPTAAPTTLAVAGRRGWVVDLRGAPVEPFEGALVLRPWQIATLHLTPSVTPSP
jgi:hypothetical protein